MQASSELSSGAALRPPGGHSQDPKSLIPPEECETPRPVHTEDERSSSLTAGGVPGSGFTEWPVTGFLVIEKTKICKQKTWAWCSKDSRTSGEALLVGLPVVLLWAAWTLET